MASFPSEPSLASLSLTHVYYNPDDYLSLLSAWLALLPQAMMVVYVTTLFCTREVECALMFVGQLGCEAVNFILKRIVREDRPRQMHGRGYGMPSSHSQFSSFFAVYIALLLLRRGLGGRDLPEWRRRTYVALAAAGSVAVAASRVYLCYHTKKQVLVGYTAGVVCAVGWYMVTAWMRETEVVWELVMWVGGLFWVRDRCLQEDLVVAGWRAAQGGVEKKVR